MSTTLHDLLARGTQLEWFEAVAVVQALCKRMPDGTTRAGTRVPDLEDIVLTSEGAIEITAGGPADQAPVYRVGQVLLALVSEQLMPVSLRLLALTAVSPTPPFASIRELTAALDYYERPDRQAILRAVYERDAQRMASPENVVPVPKIEPAPVARPKPAPTRPKPRRLLIAAGLILPVVVAAVGLWWSYRSKPEWMKSGSRQISQFVGTTRDTVARSVASGVEAVRERLGVSAPADTASVALPPEPSAAASAPSPRQARPFLPARPLWQVPEQPIIMAPFEAFAPTLDRPDAPGLDASPAPEPKVEPEDPTLYSRQDRDVAPPVLLRPRLPSEAPAGVALAALPVMEVIVSAAGEVEFARIVTPLPDVSAAMMVSAAKTWQFKPAMRDGHPVRYRDLVRLTNR